MSGSSGSSGILQANTRHRKRAADICQGVTDRFLAVSHFCLGGVGWQRESDSPFCIELPLLLVEGQLTAFVWVCFWALYSLANTLSFFLKLTESLEVEYHQSSDCSSVLCWLSWVCLFGFFSLLPFHINFKISLIATE